MNQCLTATTISDTQKKWNEKYRIIASPHPDFAGAAITDQKPVGQLTERSQSGCIGGSVTVAGWRKVKGGVIDFDNRIFTHPNLNALNGLWVKVWYNQWLCLSLSIFQGANLIEIHDDGTPDFDRYR